MDKEQFDQKILAFAIGLGDMYRDEEEKVSNNYPKLETDPENLTEDFTAMVYAVWTLYRSVTGNEIDILEFTHIANRLVVQKPWKKLEEGNHE